MRKTLYLMCGPAGTGKSTYVSRKIISEDKFCHHSSRDTIRFGLLKEGEHYFAREDEVFDLFCEDINETLHSDLYDCVFADATHLTAKSRQKTLDKLNLKDIDIVLFRDIFLLFCLFYTIFVGSKTFTPCYYLKYCWAF